MNSNDSYNKYSVLMSVYKNDDSECLKAAIDSMLTQTISPEQFVIVEDGPVKDEIDKLISEYDRNNHNLFTIVKLEHNGGLGNALNQGLKRCRNELIARMDADDISLPQRCEKQLNRFNECKKLCILGTQIKEFIDTPDNVVSARNVPCSYEGIKKFAKRRSPFNHPTVMYKKATIDSLGGYQTYGRKEDLDLFVRAVNTNQYFENLDEQLLLYRTSKDNLARRRTWINCKEYILVMWGFFKKKYCGIDDFLYVLFGQLAMFLMPNKIVIKLNNRFLRTRGKL